MELKSLHPGNTSGIRLSVHLTFIILITWVFISSYPLEQNMNPVPMNL